MYKWKTRTALFGLIGIAILLACRVHGQASVSPTKTIPQTATTAKRRFQVRITFPVSPADVTGVTAVCGSGEV